ncbi:Carbohydrate phosphatase [Glarea lozoyensis ATCC 20868]|uniref:Inositol-1-monophosphatase n=1 Tax=Glarea lozoyensis (strain ATCC 20868 / MF5171) TaxID=1116229 RepID=S3CEM6_GLAL2|nr:Carbohydrate phosphatase [Glarea lozoyensis ATCC 20868]EPE24947.1 Carbohydrate phosphatase [Glarea lozoyensis ATCC 20868]
MTYTLSKSELEEIYNFALDLGRRAGQILIEGVDKRTGEASGRGDNVEVEKVNAVDIVTQTDLDVEAFVKDEITKKYPSHSFIGEETYSSGSSKEYLIKDDPTWCVDPLDGTVNYTHLFPMFCVSIALVLNGMPVVGVIYQPMLDTTYSAYTGGGAWQDDSHPLKPRRPLPYITNPTSPLPPNAPSGCIFACEWGKDRRGDTPTSALSKKVTSFLNLASELNSRDGKGGMAHGIRSLGSATLDLAYVATGAFDIWWEGGCWEWDVAAGICILREAGGLVTTANPPADWETCRVPEVVLGGRLYLAIRPAGGGKGESGREGQERVVREVWKRVETLEYGRPGFEVKMK